MLPTKPRRCARLVVPALLACLLASCVCHEHRIGLGPSGTGSASKRQFYLLFGLVRANEVDVQRLATDLTSYSIETEYSLVDLLLQPFLLPFTITSRTVTVNR